MNPRFEMPSESWQVAARTALEQAQRELRQRDRVLDYLHTVRGLEPSAIDLYGLGYLPADGGGHRFGDYWMPGGIVIPWYRDGALVQLRVRCQVGNLAAHLGVADDAGPEGRPRDKYMTMSGGKTMYHLWGVDDLKASGFVLVTEGEFDAMIAIQQLDFFSDDLSVVTIGAANNRFDETFIQQVSNGCYWVLIATDRDPAGANNGKALTESLVVHDLAAQRYLQRMQRQIKKSDGSLLYLLRQSLDLTPFAAQVAVPEGKDITDYVLAGGDLTEWYLEQRRWRFWLVQDMDPQHYEYYRLMQGKVDRLTMRQRELIQHRCLPKLSVGPSLTSAIAEAQGWIEAYKQGRATIKDYARVDSVLDEWLEVAALALAERLSNAS